MHRTNRRTRSIFAAAISLTLLGVAHAGTDGTWVGGGGDTNWSNSNNWTGTTIADGADGNATFSLDVSGNQTITVDAPRTIGNLTFSDTDPVNTPGNWVITRSGTNTLTLQTSSGVPTINVSSLGDGNFAQLNVPVAGNQGVHLTGNGTILFTQANTFTGDLTIDSGVTLSTASGFVATAGDNVAVNGALLLRVTANVVVNSLSGSGTIGTDSAAPAADVTFRVKQGSFSGNISDGPGGANGSHLAVVFDTSASGLLDLSGVNSYTGDTLVRGGGTLRLSSSTALPDSSYLRMEGSGTVELNTGGDFVRKLGGSAHAGGTNFGSGTNGFGTVGQDRSVTFTDGTNSTPVQIKWTTGGFNPGVFILGTPTSDHKTTLVNPIDINAASGTARVLAAGNGSADIDAEYSGQLSNTAATTGSLTLSGPGTMLLSADNSSFTTAITINTGIVRLASPNSLGSPTTGIVTISGGAGGTGRLELTDGLTISKPLTLQGRQGASSLSPAISGVSGNATVSSAISASAGGNLYNFSSEAGSLTITGTITNTAGGSRFLQFMGAAGQGYVTSNITGPFFINKYGNGTWTLSGPANTYTGDTAVHAGTLILASSQTTTNSILVDPGALLQVSPGGDKTIKTHALTLTDTAKLDLADNLLALTALTAPLRSMLFPARASGDWTGPGLTSSSAAAQPNHLTAIGYALASELSVTTWGSASVSPTDTLAKYTWYGDANLDGTVNADDFALIDDGFATSAATWSHGDFNYDGIVDQNDYLLIDTVFGQTQGLSPAFLADRESRFGDTYVQTLLASVPEPASLSSILYPLSSLLLSRRRRRSR